MFHGGGCAENGIDRCIKQPSKPINRRTNASKGLARSGAANLGPAKSLFRVTSMVIYATATATSNNFQSTVSVPVQWDRSFTRQSGAELYLCELAGEQASAFITRQSCHVNWIYVCFVASFCVLFGTNTEIITNYYRVGLLSEPGPFIKLFMLLDA